MRDSVCVLTGRQATAEDIAVALVEGFDRHYGLFRETTAAAKQRFEDADWHAVQRAVQERIRFYDERVREAVERLRVELHADEVDSATWQQAKLIYIGFLVDHKRPELAETFFNSVITKILHRTYSDNDFIFVRAAVSTEYIESEPPTYRSYYPAGGVLPFAQAFRDFGWTRPFADLDRDVAHVVRALGETPRPEPNHQLQVLGSPFYRNKAAYVIGKIVNGHDEQPFLVPVLHDEQGRLELDTVLLDRQQIDVLFSLSRAYFMVDMDVPSGYVQFLRSMLPMRPRSELYTMLGLGKQGKTLFYRDLLHHLHHSQDLFVEAPGIRGQVMHVFTLPSYPYVFKVIRDVFGPSKTIDHATVRAKFTMVKEVDRVGRMTDALEFVDLTLPRERFSGELLAQLQELAPSLVELNDGSVVLRHCYAERRMVPLNVHLDRASPEELDDAVRQYGDAIRELAIANIFPGDMLWKNFGLTRYGRVVFYDYDEIEYLTDCTFRRLPEAPYPEAELAAEPWYGVSRTDVFPEEFARFLLGNPQVHEAFMRHHADLLEPAFWLACQRRIEAGEIQDFFPYPESMRFRNGELASPGTNA